MKNMKKLMAVMASLVLIALSAQAVTYTNYPASAGTSGGLPAVAAGGAYLLTSTYDQSKASVTALGNGDVVKMIVIPANTLVLGAGIGIQTAAPVASGATITLGDSASATGYLASTSVTNAISAWSTLGFSSTTNPVTINGFSGGKLYTTADYIKMTVSGVPSNAVLTVKALAIPVLP